MSWTEMLTSCQFPDFIYLEYDLRYAACTFCDTICVEFNID